MGMLNLEVFGHGRLQDFAALLTMAAGAGVTDVAALQRLVADRLRDERGAARAVKAASRSAARKGGMLRAVVTCRACGAPAKVERVNVCPSTMVGGAWRSSVSCTDPGCLLVELSAQTVAEVAQSWH